MEVIPIQHQHLEAVGDALTRAFMEYPINRYVLPDAERRRKLLLWTYPRWVRSMMFRGEALTTSDCAGAALWRNPESGLWSWLWDQVRAGVLQAPFKLRPGELWRLCKADAEATKRMRRNITSPHWVLDLLGVPPERQGEGISRKLLEPTLARADAQGLPCYLITNKEENIAIYGRFGFKVIEEGFMSGTDVMFYELRRPPLLGQ